MVSANTCPVNLLTSDEVHSHFPKLLYGKHTGNAVDETVPNGANTRFTFMQIRLDPH